MAETITINAATREIKVPESEVNFGVAGERKVEKKHFRIEGRIVEGTDLALGFAWKVSCENAGKELCADLIDSILADTEGIEFDWTVGAGPMAYKGDLKFSVCATKTDALGNILQEWHSQIGHGNVANGIEATVQNIGGQDLAAWLQQNAAAAKANAESAANSEKAAADSAAAASRSAGNSLGYANQAAKDAKKAANSAEQAKENANAAGEAAKKVIDEGITEKLSKMQQIETNVEAAKDAVNTAAATTTKARDDAEAAQQNAADSASAALASQQTAANLAAQAKAAADTAAGYAGAATFSIGYDSDGMLTLFMAVDDGNN